MKRELLLAVVLVCLGAFYGCQPPKSDGQKNLNEIKDLKVRQYAIAGREIYQAHCANCHQKDGTGLGLVIPPLKESDYMLADKGRTIRIIRHGLKGEITVNGQTFNQPMPANPTLTPIEIAQLMTYIYAVWGDQEELITIEQVNGHLVP